MHSLVRREKARGVSPLPPEGRAAFSVPHKAGHEARAGRGAMRPLAQSGGASFLGGSGKGAEGTLVAVVSVSIVQLLFDPPSPWLTDRRMRHVLSKNTERPGGRAGGSSHGALVWRHLGGAHTYLSAQNEHSSLSTMSHDVCGVLLSPGTQRARPHRSSHVDWDRSPVLTRRRVCAGGS